MGWRFVSQRSFSCLYASYMYYLNTFNLVLLLMDAKEWTDDKWSEGMFQCLDIRNWFTRLHPLKGENHTKKCELALKFMFELIYFEHTTSAYIHKIFRVHCQHIQRKLYCHVRYHSKQSHSFLNREFGNCHSLPTRKTLKWGQSPKRWNKEVTKLHKNGNYDYIY